MDTIQWHRASSEGYPADGREVLILIKDTDSPVMRTACFEWRDTAGHEYWDCDLYGIKTYDADEVEYWADLPELPKGNKSWTTMETLKADDFKRLFPGETIIYRSEQGIFTILNKHIIPLRNDSFPSLEVGECARAEDIFHSLYKTSKFSDNDIKDLLNG